MPEYGTTDQSVPPLPGEIEVSLFGPGYGESVVVHLGHGDWLVVDSCIDKRTDEAVPLSYLRSLSVDVSQRVCLIVASHWHDDHIRGLEAIYEEATNAALAFSAALMEDEFFTLVQAQRRSILKSSGVRTMGAVLDILEQRMDPLTGLPQPKLAKGETVLWTRHASGSIPASMVLALSPSDAGHIEALRQIGGLNPVPDEPKRRTQRVTPNRASVALWVSVADIDLLLGGDLEETSDPATGWTAIVNSPTRPRGVASVFKVPHHGSVNGYQERVWDEMLATLPSAVVAPHVLGRNCLPTSEGSRLICNKTDLAYLTAPAVFPSARTRHGATGKMVEQTVRTIRDAEALPGHTRLRRPIDGSSGWQVEHFGTSSELCAR